MNKSIFTILFSIFAALTAFAQAPTITSANMFNMYEVDKQYTADTTGVAPGVSGANVTWDFSSLQATSPEDSIGSKYVHSWETPYPNDFPTANYATQSLGSQSFAYMTYSGGILSIVGVEGQQVYGGQTYTIKQVFDKPEVAFVFPFTYNTSNTSNFHASYDVAGTTVNLIGTQTLKGDGYGTLKIMGHTYTNVLRIHNITNEYDSIAGYPMNIPTSLEAWVYTMPGKKESILTISLTTSQGQGSKSVTYNTNSKTSGIEYPSLYTSELSVFPNPARKNCTLNYNAQKDGKATLHIINLLGEEIYNRNIQVITGQNNIPVSISDIPHGIYFMSIRSDEGIATQRLVVE